MEWGVDEVFPSTLDNGSVILTWEINTINIIDFTLEPSGWILDSEIQLMNFTSGEFDTEILDGVDFALIYNKTTQTDYIYSIPINQLQGGEGVESNKPYVTFNMNITVNGSAEQIWLIDFTVVYDVDITFDGGGWDEFSDRMMEYVLLVTIYIVIIGVLGIRFGLMGGGLACIIGAIIVMSLSDPELIPLVILMFMLAFLFFLAEYKKQNLGFRTEIV